MQSDRDLPREKARYQPPTIQVVKLLTKETVLGNCKTSELASGPTSICSACYSTYGTT